MTTTFRIDDNLKRQCDEVFDELGLNMTSALTIFLKQVVRTRSIPFIIGPYDHSGERMREASTLNEDRIAWDAFETSRKARIARGGRELTMDEINDEISAAHSIESSGK